MVKNIGLVWLKDDFRLKKNLALIEATKNHDQVVAFFLYKKNTLNYQEAQKWWISKSLKDFKKKLLQYNINLEIIEIDSYKLFFEKLFNKKNYSIYWNRKYEPNYLKFDQYLSRKFKDNKISFSIFKGNILNEFEEIKKKDGTPFRVFTPYWRYAEKFFLEKIPPKEKKISKCIKKTSFFNNIISEDKICPKKKWSNKFEKYWQPNEENEIGRAHV